MKNLAVLSGVLIAVLVVLLLFRDEIAESSFRVRPEEARQAARASVNVDAPASDAEARESLNDPIETSAKIPADGVTDPQTVLVVRAISSDTGEPVPDIRVAVFNKAEANEGLTAFKSAITDGDGNALLQVPPDADLLVSWRRPEDFLGRMHIDVSALDEGEERVATVELPTEGSHFHGRVVDRENVTPIVGAQIHVDPGVVVIAGTDLEAGDNLLSTKPTAARTGLSGEFALPFDSWNYSYALITATGYAPATFRLDQGFDSRASARVIEMDRESLLRGVVIGPTEELLVHLITEGYNLDHGASIGSGEELTWKVLVNANGTFELGGLPARAPLRASIHGPDGALLKLPVPLLLAAGETREVRWEVGVGTSIHGVVIDESGGPVDGLSIWLAPATEGPHRFLYRFESHIATRTDASGLFTFENVAAGNWRIGPEPSDTRDRELNGDSIAPDPIEVSISASAREQHVRLPIHRNLFIRGRVLADNGRPRADRWVTATQKGRSLNAVSAEDGSFVIGPLTPGAYTLAVMGAEEDAPSKPILVEAGAENAVIRLPAGASVSGTIVIRGSGEMPEGGAHVSILEGAEFYTSTFSPTGGFEFDGLAPGTYTIVASQDSGLSGLRTDLNIAAGTPLTGVVVELSEGAMVRVGYSGSKAAAFVNLYWRGHPVAMDGIGRGEEQLFVVPAGHISVDLFARDDWTSELPRPVTKKFEAVAGETTTIEFADP